MIKVSTTTIILIIISFLFVSCSNSQNTLTVSQESTEVTNTNVNLTSTENNTNQSDNKLTNTIENQTSLVENEGTLKIDDIKDDFKNNYPDATIVNMNKFKDEYILVEYQYIKAESANMFALYDLKTGARNNLPSTGFYTKLLRIIDENNIKLLSTGENSEVNTACFPFILDFHRDGNNLDFTSKIESYFADINQSIVFGDDSKNEVIYSIKQNPNDVEIYFKPLSDKDAQNNFLLNEYIPLTTTSYDKKNKQFTLDFNKTVMDNDLIIEKNESDYYLSLNISTSEPNNSKIVIDLKDNAKLYTAEVEIITDVSVRLKITFK